MSTELTLVQTGALAPLGVAPAAQALKPWQDLKLASLLAQIAPALDAWRSGQGKAVVRSLLGACAEISADTAANWHRLLEAHGPSGLTEKYVGRIPRDEPWHPRARYFFELPTKPNNGAIANKLRQEGYGRHLKPSTFTKQVERLRERTPANQADASVKRNGWHHTWQNKTKHARRDWKGVPVGYRYEVDGHTCDFYIEHPSNGGYFQPELTLWMDVRSRKIVGFWLGENENSADLRYSLSSVIGQHGHVPDEIHLDHGAGKAETFTNDVSGYCAKLAIHPEFAKARNARSKIIEGEFGRFKARFSAFEPTFICERTDDFFRDFARKWKDNKVPRTTLWQAMDKLRAYFADRDAQPMQVQDQTVVPDELWATLRRNPPMIEKDAISRPREVRVVQSCTVTIIKRDFHSLALNVVEGRKVLVEYDEYRSDLVWVYTLSGVFIAVAEIIRERPGIEPNVVQARLARREAGQLKRLEVRRADLQGKNRQPISAASWIDALEGPTADAPPSAIALHLAQGHSLTAPPAVIAAPRREVPVDLAPIRDAIDAAQTPRSTPEQRFAQAQRLERDGCTDDDDAAWLSHYQKSNEYHARGALHDAFNAA